MTDPLTAATPAITTALTDQGHTAAYAACVIAQMRNELTGTKLAFAIAVLTLGSNATASQLQAAVTSSGITTSDKTDVPDQMHAIDNTCANTDNPG